MRGWLSPIAIITAATAAYFGGPFLRFAAVYILGWSLAVFGAWLLLRYGLVNFGIGASYALGAYAAGLMYRYLHTADLAVHLLAAVGAAGAWGALNGAVGIKTRGIYYSLLSLSLSMVLYGVLVKFYTVTGGSDGLYMPDPRLLGVRMGTAGLLALAALLAAAWAALGEVFGRSYAGHVAAGIKINELRTSALGADVGRHILVSSVLASIAAGLGGLIVGYSTSHVSPDFAYWVTSGKMVVGGLIASFLPWTWGFVASAALYQAVELYSLQFAYPELVVGGLLLAILAAWRLYYRR
ncbi:MAG: branched-chain amino acid ABC transporter permease [Thermoproteus sp.]